MRLAAVQMESHVGCVEVNVDRALDLVATAVEAGASLVSESDCGPGNASGRAGDEILPLGPACQTPLDPDSRRSVERFPVLSAVRGLDNVAKTLKRHGFARVHRRFRRQHPASPAG